MRRIRVACVQMKASASSADNLARAASKVREAARRGARIVCLQELFRTPYFPIRQSAAAFRLAEPVPARRRRL